jgi:hypothetical protein
MIGQNPSHQPDSAVIASTERRVAVRYSTDVASSCAPVQGVKDYPWYGRVGDISRTGLSLLLGRRFEPGTLLAVELHDRTHQPMHKLLVRVIRVKKLRPSEWLVGCALHSRLTDAEAMALSNDERSEPTPQPE